MNGNAVLVEQPVIPNGGALGAVLAAGIGAFTLALAVIANEAGMFEVPAIYGPSGGLSGRSTLAVIVWLIAWGILHARWRNRNVAVARVVAWSLVLVAMAVIMTFPPAWKLIA